MSENRNSVIATVCHPGFAGDSLALRPIDLSQHSGICTSIRASSFVESFGNADAFWGGDGKGGGRYINWLERKMSALPGSCLHLWYYDRIIGQIEVGRGPKDSEFGWIYLIFVQTAWRRRGLGRYLLWNAQEILRKHGLSPARLRVAPANSAAIGLYTSSGWRMVGEGVDEDHLLMMETDLDKPIGCAG